MKNSLIEPWEIDELVGARTVVTTDAGGFSDLPDVTVRLLPAVAT